MPTGVRQEIIIIIVIILSVLLSIYCVSKHFRWITLNQQPHKVCIIFVLEMEKLRQRMTNKLIPHT